MRYAFILGLGAAITALDQWTKHLVLTLMSLHEYIPVTGFFNLVSVRNRGAAFGFLNDPNITWQFWFFVAATVMAFGVIMYVAKTAGPRDRALFFGLGCITGGAAGNLIDRVRFREVIDFLDFHWNDMHWPAFNVADIAICVGAGLVMLLMLRPAPKEE